MMLATFFATQKDLSYFNIANLSHNKKRPLTRPFLIRIKYQQQSVFKLLRLLDAKTLYLRYQLRLPLIYLALLAQS